MKRFGLLSLAFATAVTMACNGGRNDNATNDVNNAPAIGTSGVADRNTVSASDRNWAQDMLADGEAEVQLGKMAEMRAMSPDVKRFAHMMVEDHTKAGEELKQIAAQYNITPDPARHDDKHKDLMDKLSKLRGAEFDREYMTAMVDGHEDVIDHLQSRVDSNATLKERVKGSVGTSGTENTNVRPEKADNHAEAGLNQWAANALPTVQHHLDEAKQIKDKLTGSRRNTTARK